MLGWYIDIELSGLTFGRDGWRWVPGVCAAFIFVHFYSDQHWLGGGQGQFGHYSQDLVG